MNRYDTASYKESLISILKASTALTTLVPSANIYTGYPLQRALFPCVCLAYEGGSSVNQIILSVFVYTKNEPMNQEWDKAYAIMDAVRNVFSYSSLYGSRIKDITLLENIKDLPPKAEGYPIAVSIKYLLHIT